MCYNESNIEAHANGVGFLQDLTGWATLLKEREVSATEVLEFYLHRIENYDPMLNAFLTIPELEARSRAKLADARLAREEGRIFEGVPMAIKDLFDTKGVATTGAAMITAARVPEENATAWEKLENQGAILLGKLNMHEFAYGTTSENPHFGPVHNPWDVARISGGSSGGSAAAVAADLIPASLGTDTGGSIRIPAALSGIYGLKPTYGLISKLGVMPLAFSLDHVGPMARSVRDIALLLEACAGYDPRDPDSVPQRLESYTSVLGRSIRGLKVGYEEEYFLTQVDPEVGAKVREVLAVLEEAGAIVKRIKAPELQEVPQTQVVTIACEALAEHEHWIADKDAPYGEDVRARLLAGRQYSGVDYANALKARRRITRSISRWFADIDLFVGPPVGFPATPIGDREVLIDGVSYAIRPHLNRFTSPFNLTGLPAMSVPCGFSQSGLPLAVQLVGGIFQEATILQAAAVLENAYPFKAPPLFS